MVYTDRKHQCPAAAALGGGIGTVPPDGDNLRWEYECGDGKTSFDQSDGKRYNIIIKLGRAWGGEDGWLLDKESPRRVYLVTTPEINFLRAGEVPGKKEGVYWTTTTSVETEKDPHRNRIRVRRAGAQPPAAGLSSPEPAPSSPGSPPPQSRWQRFWTKDRVEKAKTALKIGAGVMAVTGAYKLGQISGMRGGGRRTRRTRRRTRRTRRTRIRKSTRTRRRKSKRRRRSKKIH